MRSSRLTPLGSVQCWRQRKRFRFQADIIQTACQKITNKISLYNICFLEKIGWTKRGRTFLVVAVDFVGADARIFRFSSGVDTLLLVDLHVLMALEDEGFIVTSAFSTVQLQHGGRSETTHFDRVPLAVVDGDGS